MISSSGKWNVKMTNIIAIMAIGILMKKSQCQVAISSIPPPKSGPIILDTPQTLHTMPMILYLNGISNASLGTICDNDIITPAPNP